MIVDEDSVMKLRALKNSDWIDEHTRFLLIDFSLMNAHTHMASTVRIRFDFRRDKEDVLALRPSNRQNKTPHERKLHVRVGFEPAPSLALTALSDRNQANKPLNHTLPQKIEASDSAAPTWYSYSFHFFFELFGNQEYFLTVAWLIFFILSAHNILKELVLVYKMGLINRLLDYHIYIEMLKVLLSILLCVVFFRASSLATRFVQDMKRSYESRGQNSPEFFDSFELAALDYVYRIAGGFLAFLCIFQIFEMLKKIRRLLVFMRLLVSVFMLFCMPLIAGVAFAILALILFGHISENFSQFVTSCLTISQYFVKPRAIYHTLLENNPLIGPWFVFILGLCINFFILSLFIAFLNEAYSFVKNQIRLQSYKVRAKTKLEYVYEFLGIQSTIKWDIDKTTLAQERELDRDFMADVKRFAVD
ncbi:polycystic kidney disease and receptor for egg jelly-related protein [Plakobranchus ocellatus]|uniref:Polycystic kidney disease and receptor for egg jelly-related protein n=1 Tax=Plakobranchus ocellatus TaxID=259542 RepID=A0AAV3Z2W5_9GAST|nr:polycystic kidney disease and receptor for egg jelly-related protein [Plakobranchus ocellatus]